MGRVKRDYPLNAPIHITQKASNSEYLFADPYFKEYYCALLSRAVKIFQIKVFNYTVMDNHIHLIACELKEGELSRSLHMINTTFSRGVNKQLNRSGALWNCRSDWTPVESYRHLIEAMVYVDLNAVRAKTVDDPSKYHYSGTRELAGLIKPYSIDLVYVGQTLGWSNFSTDQYKRLLETRVQEGDLSRTPKFKVNQLV